MTSPHLSRLDKCQIRQWRTCDSDDEVDVIVLGRLSEVARTDSRYPDLVEGGIWDLPNFSMCLSSRLRNPSGLSQSNPSFCDHGVSETTFSVETIARTKT